MALQYDDPSGIATDCEDPVLHAPISDNCPEVVELELSEIVNLYLALPNVASPNLVAGTPVMTSIVGIEAAKTAGTLVSMPVIADLPAPEIVTAALPRGLSKTVNGKYTITADYFDFQGTNYEELRKMQAGLRVRFWYETLGGFMYGDTARGIWGTVSKVTFPKERGKDSYAKAIITVEFDSKFDPPRFASPYAA